MPIGNYQGRARTRASNPSAKGECDRCGRWWQLGQLKCQSQWAGSGLTDTGFLVCPRCLDVPQEQNRSIVLQGDPQPVNNPRPSRDAANAAVGMSSDRVSSTGPVSDTSTVVSGT